MSTVFSLVHAAAKPVLRLGTPPDAEVVHRLSRQGKLTAQGKRGMEAISDGHIQVSVRAAFSGDIQPVLARAAADQQRSAVLVDGHPARDPVVRCAERAELMEGVLALLPDCRAGSGEFAMIHAGADGEISDDYATEVAAVYDTITRPRAGTVMLGLSIAGRSAFDHEQPRLLVLDNNDGRYVIGLLTNQHGGTTLLHHAAGDDIITTWITNAISDYETLVG